MDDERAALDALGTRLVAQGLDASLWERSRALVEEVHGHQQRSTGGSYLDFLIRVAELLETWSVEPLIVLGGLLHEVTSVGKMRLQRAQRRLDDPDASQLLGTLAQMAKQMAVVTDATSHRPLQELFDTFVTHSDAALIHCAAALTALRDAQNGRDKLTRQLLARSQEVTQPLLERLGLWDVRTEVAEHSLRLRAPDRYYELEHWRQTQWANPDVQARLGRWRTLVENALKAIPLALLADDVRILQRGAASIERRQFGNDAVRLAALDARYLALTVILVPTIDDAYRALRVLHRCGQPITASFRDYFAQPRPNGYAALHTRVIHEGIPLSIRITTRNLYPLTRQGILTEAARAARAGRPLPTTWEADEQESLEQFFRVLEEPADAAVHLLTPAGDRIKLDPGATVLDFAYHIHSRLGQRAGTARVNGEEVPLHYQPYSGDLVEILPDPNRSAPDDEWVDWVTMPKHKALVLAQLRRRPEERGHRLLDEAMRQRGRLIENYGPRIADVATDLGMTRPQLFCAIAQGQQSADDVADALISVAHPIQKRYHITLHPDYSVRFPQWHDGLLRPARCCTTQPGTPIVGYVQRNGLFTLHAANCATVPRLQNAAIVPLEWVVERKPMQRVELELTATNRKGLINDITLVIRSIDADLFYIEGKRRQEMDTVRMTLEIANDLELAHLVSALNRLQNVNLLRVNGESAQSATQRLARHLSAPSLIPMLFSPGRTISDERLLAGRVDELERIEQSLTHPDGIVLHLYGSKRIGKSSLLRVLERRPLVRQRLHYVFVDFQGLRTRDEAGIFFQLAKKIAATIDPREATAVPPLSHFERGPATAFTDYLTHQRYHLAASPKKLTLAFDEMAWLLDAYNKGSIGAEFFMGLRHILQHHPINAILCTSTDVDPALLTLPGVRELFQLSFPISVGHLDDRAARDLVQRPLRGYVYYEPEALDEMLYAAAGHPYYLQIMGAGLITVLNANRRRHIFAEDVRALVESGLSLSGDEFAQYHGSEAEMNILRALAAPPQPRDGMGVSRKEVEARLRGARRYPKGQTIEELLFALMDRDTIVAHESQDGLTRYRIRIPLFAQWLARSRPLHL